MIYTLEQCRDRGASHAAYGWYLNGGWDTDANGNSVEWTDEKRLAYFRGYHQYNRLTGDVLEARIVASMAAYKAWRGDLMKS